MRPVIRLCWRGAIRPLLHHPRAALLGVLSIALGVAVFLAITVANRSAAGSFHRAFEMVTGSADLEIRGKIPETLLPQVQLCTGVAGATPLIESMVTLPDTPGESLRLAGIDPFTAKGLLGFEATLGSDSSADSSGDLGEWLAADDTIAVTREFLSNHGLKPGDTLRLQGPGAPRTMRITHVIGTGDGAVSGVGVVATDLATAQEWTGRTGLLTAILVKLEDPAQRDEVARRLRSLLPGDVTVDPPARRSRQVDIMLSAFRLNLTALSLVSLMVGMFFVGNSAAAAVVRRRVSLGILRAVGTGRGEILVMVLAEAGLSGLAGALLGILVSPLLAGVMAAPVSKTVTALYLPVDAQGGWPTTTEALAGVVAGVVAALVAAWIPARQAARVDPTRVLHPGAAPEIFPLPAARLAAWGAGLLLLALLLSLGALHRGPALLGFGAAFLVLAGFSLTVPAVMTTASRLCGRGRHHEAHGVIARLALGQTMRSLHRTAPTVAALAAAAAMTVGISVMIHSFRGSVVSWAGRTLTADLFIAPASNELLGLEHTIPEAAAAWWSARPEVAAVGTFREVEARTVSGEPVTLGIVSGPARGAIDFLHGDAAAKTAALEEGGCTALSESLARRLHLGPGDQLELTGPRGVVRLKVLDLYRDYTRDRGIAMVGAGYFQRVWGADGDHSLAIEFRKGTAPAIMERSRGEFVAAFGGKEAFICYGNAALKQRIMEIFNQTFAVTAVLRTISIAVAIGGVMLTLGILVLERTRDLGVLRSMGASTAQVARMMLAEAALIGFLASLVGIASGSALALVLTWVINKAFFGWSIDLSYPWLELLLLPLWMTAAALVAGFFPALRAARIPPASALRME